MRRRKHEAQIQTERTRYRTKGCYFPPFINSQSNILVYYIRADANVLLIA